MHPIALGHVLGRYKATPPELPTHRHGEVSASEEWRGGGGEAPVVTSQDEPVTGTCLSRSASRLPLTNYTAHENQQHIISLLNRLKWYLLNLSLSAIFFSPLYMLGGGPGCAGGEEGAGGVRGGGSSQITLSPLSSNINSNRTALLEVVLG